MFSVEDYNIKLETNRLSSHFVYVEDIDSTNSFLLSSDEEFEDGTIVLAEYQSNGRGRKERNWLSEKGKNLTFSILLKNNLNPQDLQVLSMYTSLAIIKALDALYDINAKLKWPNDILVNDSKICGILVEASFLGNSLEKVVIGVGLNVNQFNFPGEYRIKPTSLRRELKREVNREEVLSEIINILEELLEEFPINKIKILKEWQEHCPFVGDNIAIDVDNTTKYGIFDSIDENGNLVLKIGNTYEKINYGEIV